MTYIAVSYLHIISLSAVTDASSASAGLEESGTFSVRRESVQVVPLSSSMTSLTGLGSESRANKSSLMEMLLYTLDKFTNYSLYRGERVVSPIRINTDTSLAPDLQSELVD